MLIKNRGFQNGGVGASPGTTGCHGSDIGDLSTSLKVTTGAEFDCAKGDNWRGIRLRER
ncbi:MAG: hypothetical protein LBT55_02510 [Clostridiaceae bacterium]|nr:hypothetical protein [Clostridiaceae bacterium]